MNESTLISLKVLVETSSTYRRDHSPEVEDERRIVSHLIAVYHDESSKLPDEQLALLARKNVSVTPLKQDLNSRNLFHFKINGQLM